MPRFPRIYADSPIPSGVSTRDVPFASPGQQAPIVAGQALESAGTDFLATAAQVNGQLRKADAGLELDQAMAQLKTQFAEQDTALKAQGVHPDAYAPAVGRTLQTLGQGISKTMRYPEAQAAFQRKLVEFQTAEGVKAINQAATMKANMIQLGEAVQQKEDATAAVFGDTPMLQSEAMARGLARPENGMRQGRYSADQAASMVTGFLADVQESRAIRDFRNPDLQEQVVTNLLSGKYEYLKPERQFALAKTLVTERDAKQRQQQADNEKDAIKQKNIELGQHHLWARKKQKPDGTPYTQADIEDITKRQLLGRTEIEDLMTALEKPPVEKPSDPATRDMVFADVNSMRPMLSEQKIKDLARSGALSFDDRNAALARRTSRITHLQEHAESRMGQQQSEAERLINAQIGGFVGIMPDGLDATRRQAVAGAGRDLSAISAYFPPEPGEAPGLRRPPLDVVDSVIARWRPMVAAQADLNLENATRQATYKSMADLDAAKVALTPAQYRAERDLTLQYLKAVNNKAFADFNKLNPAQPAKPKPGAKPGTYQKGTALPTVE